MRQLKKFLNNSDARVFARDNFLFIVISLAASALNYLYYPISGRQLSSGQFAEVQVFALILLLLGTVFSVVNILAVIYFAKEKDEQAQKLTASTQKILIQFFVIAGVIFALFYPVLKTYLKVDNPGLFLAFFISVLINTLFITSLSVLQANRHFTTAGLAGALAAFAKLIAAVALVRLGLGSAGVVGAVGVGLAVGTLYIALSNHHARVVLLNIKNMVYVKRTDWAVVRKYATYLWASLAVNVLLVLLFSIDSFVAKHNFENELAGQFAAVGTLSKIIIFIAMPLTITMLPHVARAPWRSGVNRLFISASAVVSLAILQLLGFLVAGKLLLRLSFGSHYNELPHLLPLFTIVSGLGAVTYLVYNYLIIVKPRLAATCAAIAGVVLAISLPALQHATTPRALLGSLLIMFCPILFIGIVGVFLSNDKS